MTGNKLATILIFLDISIEINGQKCDDLSPKNWAWIINGVSWIRIIISFCIFYKKIILWVKWDKSIVLWEYVKICWNVNKCIKLKTGCRSVLLPSRIIVREATCDVTTFFLSSPFLLIIKLQHLGRNDVRFFLIRLFGSYTELSMS